MDEESKQGNGDGMESKMTYAHAGVNVAHVRAMQRRLVTMMKRTWQKQVIPLDMHYAGIFRIGNTKLAVHTDGVGTKVLVAHALGKYDTVGIDCVAMNANDILCVGARPLTFVDYIVLQKEDERLVTELMKGLVKGAKEAQCAIVGGETAIMGDVIKEVGEKTGFDLAGTIVGLIEREITGHTIRPGDIVLGLPSSGLHSNGFSLARRLLDVNKWGNAMLTPTRIYVRPILKLLKHCEVKGMAHITGGAFTKVHRILRYTHTGVRLSSWPPLMPIFKEMMKSVEPLEMYRTFNMGIGYLVVVHPRDESDALALLRKEGINAHVMGEITKKKGIYIESEYYKGFV